MELVLNEAVALEKKGSGIFWPQGDFYFKDQKRQATITDVTFIRDDLLVVAHRAAAKLYLVRMSATDFTVLSSLTLDTASRSINPIKRARPYRYFHPDLMCLCNDTLYITEYGNRCCTVRIDGFQLKYSGVFKIGRGGFHGCLTQGSDVLFGSTDYGGIVRFCTKSRALSDLQMPPMPRDRVKAVGAQEGYILLGVDRLQGVHTEQGATVDSWIRLYKRDGQNLELTHTLDFPLCQIDGHAFYKGHHYFTLHDSKLRTGVITVIAVENGGLREIGRAACASFPHGIDICSDRLVYTNYSQSSIICSSIDELKLLL